MLYIYIVCLICACCIGIRFQRRGEPVRGPRGAFIGLFSYKTRSPVFIFIFFLSAIVERVRVLGTKQITPLGPADACASARYPLTQPTTLFYIYYIIM